MIAELCFPAGCRIVSPLSCSGVYGFCYWLGSTQYMGEMLLCERKYKNTLMDGRLPMASSVCEDISYYLCTNPTASITYQQTLCAWVSTFDPPPQTQQPVCCWEEKHWASELCRDLEMAGACGALEEKARSQAASHLLVVEAVLQTLVALEGAVTGVLNSTRVADLGR